MGHLASGLIDEGWQAELLAIDFGDFSNEIKSVNGGFAGVIEEPNDVEDTALVEEGGFIAGKGEAPEAEILSE